MWKKKYEKDGSIEENDREFMTKYKKLRRYNIESKDTCRESKYIRA